MVKAVAVVYSILATSFIILLFTSQRNQNRRARLCRRMGFKTVNFDPLVESMERMAAEKGLSHVASSLTALKGSPSADGAEAADVYFDADGKLKMHVRLRELFQLIDVFPKDGLVEYEEMKTWNVKQAMDKMEYTTKRELQARDKNGDGLISFAECVPQLSEEDLVKNSTAHGGAGWWMEQFTNADANRDEHLSFMELKEFLHPEDSVNDKIQEWLLREKIRRMDWDYDGKLSFTEFRDAAYDTFRNYNAYRRPNHRVPSPEDEFVDLDVDRDRHLTVHELKPVRRFIFPGEVDYATYYATYLMQELSSYGVLLLNNADDNKDGKLSLDEVLNHEYIFYTSSIYPEYEGYEDDDDDYHDEL